MKSDHQWRPVTRAFPSPPACLARTLPHGGLEFDVLRNGCVDVHFIPKQEAVNVYGGAEGWIAHMLLKHVAGDPKLG